MNSNDFVKVLEKEKLVVVVRGKSVDDAIKTAKACVDGGVRLIEITFTVPEADLVIFECRKALSASGAIIGAGTVLSIADAEKALDAGADFVVSPCLDETVTKYVIEKSVAYIPGILTPTEYVRAKAYGAQAVKLFPGDVAKPEGLKALLGPFPSAKIMPTGGVAFDNLEQWFKSGAIAVGAGSNLTKGAKVGDFDGVTCEAQKWIKKIKEIYAK